MSKQLTPYQRAALDYKRHISLVANAGSGKTFVLSKRFVEIYKKEEIDLNEIVAITFTDKAAGELNRKIADEVEEQILNEENPKQKKKLEKLRRELVLANISTIHSFCINILKEFAPEAGIDASFSPIDQQLAEELIDLSVEETFQSAIRDNSFASDLMYLVRMLGSKSFLQYALKDAIHQRRNLSSLASELYSKTKEEIADEFKKRFEESASALLKDIIESGINSIEFVNNSILEKDPENKYAVPIADILMDINLQPYAVRISKLFQIKKEILTSTENSVRKVGYLNKNRNNYLVEIEHIEKLYETITPFAEIDVSGKSELELAELGKTFISLLTKSLGLYENKKKIRGYLDFEDILLFTNEIIKNTSVQDFLREKYKYIMIDEYQDTNQTQYDIFMPILDYLSEGNLFVVGDEKQSIYMFRNADLEVFDKTKRDIENKAELGSNINLPHSFRMYPQLVLFTNKLFANLFANPQKEFNEVAPSDLICTKNDDDIGSVGILLADSNSDVEESDLIAKKILTLLKNDEALQYGDIAILCRKRKSFSEIETSLVKYKLPYAIMGGKGFYQRQAIYDIYNYLTFLINPKDDQALIACLRSPFFNISDSKLLKIALLDKTFFYEKVKACSSSDKTITSVVSILNDNLNQIACTEPYLLIRKLLNESGYWSVLSSKKNCEQEVANVEKLLALSREFSRKGFKNLYDFTASLKEFIEGYEDEGQAQVVENQNAVKLMTIHQSKGLEFKAVFIYGTNSKGQDDNVKARELIISKEFGLLAKVPIDRKYFSKYSVPPIAAFYNYKIKRKNYAELKRLFYVAVTRAIKYLYISASHKEYKAVKGSFYELLCNGLGNSFKEKNIYLASDIAFMAWEKEEFVTKKKRVELNIAVEIELKDEQIAELQSKEHKDAFKLINESIKSYPKHEIISATKISMYSQCPVKYELTYDVGYLPLLNLIKRHEREYEFQLNEDEINLKLNAQLRGKIIHKCLSENVKLEKLNQLVGNLLEAEAVSDVLKLTSSIINDVSEYYRSNAYNELNEYPNYQNEYEVYCREGEFYLYGIIDKLIFGNSKLIVVDYKTDSVEKEKLQSRAENYFTQLRFYSFVLSRLYPTVKNYELRLVFIKHPDEVIKLSLSREEVLNVGNMINNAIKNINTYNFLPNIGHCKSCQYALEGDTCVKSS